MRRAALTAVVAALLVVGGTGCTGSGGGPDRAGSSAPTAPAQSGAKPVVGECRTYDAQAAAASTETSAPVKCATSHTAQTFVVADGLPDPDQQGRWTDDQLAAIGIPACNGPALTAQLKLSSARLATMRITKAFFGPTPEQAKAGARWVRCDAYVVDEGRPVLLTGELATLAAPTGAFAQCALVPPPALLAASRCAGGEGLYAAIGVIEPDQGTVRTAAQNQAACQAAWSGQSKTGRVDAWVVTTVTVVAGQTAPPPVCWLPYALWKVDRTAWPAEPLLGSTVQA